ncbi:hypothetical protein [Actinomadura harenae]|uniref:Uncharacterized protein n=1 Tax=Actinomadura harenae TaxID=2483351 RepID=A0A3M2M7P2_9ACTN|nr:hypothetical protein [Actinomadura harenae]RMI44873.1 hypothetical protein EBO15_11350 [Actinomadura harenae]
MEPTAVGIVVRDPERPGAAARVECRERPSDGDRMWFWGPLGPLVEADRIPDAIVAIRSLLTHPSDGAR